MTSSSVESDSTSTSLLRRAVANDQAAWEEVVRLYGGPVYSRALAAGLQSESAADILQDVLLQVHVSLAQFARQRSGSFRTWLRTITRTKILDFLRKRNRHPEAKGGTSGQQLIESLETPELSDEAFEFEFLVLRQVLDLVRSEVAPHTWEAFWMMEADGLSAKEVAVKLSLSEGAVFAAHSRVRKRLSGRLNDLP